MMKHMKWTLLAVAVVAAGYLNFSVFSWKSSVKEIEALCGNIPSGSDISQIESAVESINSLQIDGPVTHDGSEQYIVRSKDPVSSATCTIKATKGLVTLAAFEKLTE